MQNLLVWTRIDASHIQGLKMNLKILVGENGTRRLVDDSGRMHLVSGPDELVQKLEGFLNCNQGEWTLDETFFLPWTDQVLVKNPDLPAIEALIKAGITSRNGVERLVSYSQIFDPAARTLTINFVVLTSSGVLVERIIQGNPVASDVGLFLNLLEC